MYAFNSSILIAFVAVLVGPAAGVALFIFSAGAANGASTPDPVITVTMHP